MAHWRPVVKLLQYLKLLQYVRRTLGTGITCDGDGNGRTVMRAFVDSDHATCRDTRRSISDEAVLLGGGTFSWFSMAQATTAEGIPKAEYVAVSEIAKEVLFLRQVEDNQGAIKMANNRHPSKRTRHIDIKHHLIRDAVGEGQVRVTYVKTEDQNVDVLTKPLDRTKST